MLTVLGDLKVLTTAQVQRMLFASERTALRRIRRLRGAGYVRCLRSSAVPHRLVMLTARGAAAAGGCSANGSSAHSPLFLAHLLGVNDFRIALAQACARTNIELAGFLTDTAVADARRGVQPKRVLSEALGVAGAHVPDGAFVLKRGGRAALFFLEFDRGTEVIGNPHRGLGKIMTSYLKAFSSSGYLCLARELGVTEQLRSFRVLIVTSSEGRLSNIRRKWGADVANQPASRFVWLAPDSVLTTPDLLRERWVPLDPTDARTYSIGGE